MVKSLMDFFDVVFPLNIGPLTYRRPSGYNGQIAPGMAVRAEVRRTLRYGIVLREASDTPRGPVKELAEVVPGPPLYNSSLTRLVSWMAEYYIATEGVALKSMLPKEIFEKPGMKRRGGAKPVGGMIDCVPADIDDTAILSAIKESVSKSLYGTYLLNAQSARHELSFLLEVLRGVGNVIILAPEISFLEWVSGGVRAVAGERLALMHGKLSRSDRRRSLQKIISGEADVVLGTRLAIFAPLKAVSAIFVLQEQNRLYKNLEGLRYQARDVAVMRGYLEKATVVLSSPTPSLESFYNTVKGKYMLLRPEGQIPRPRIEVVNMKTARKETPYLSKRSLQAAASQISKGGSVLFFINRKGYSLLQCAECNDIPSCAKCGIPLIYHKDSMLLKCHYCRQAFKAPGHCAKCRSVKIEMVGAGTQRIASDIRKHLAIEPLRFDKDALRDDPNLKKLFGETDGNNLIVGTKALTGRLRSKDTYDLCVFLNPDIGLHLPDFRSQEMLFQEIVGMSEFIDPDGLIVLQTRMPEGGVYKYVKSYRLHDFLEEELAVRKSLMYPPFSRLAAITISSADDIGKRLQKSVTLHDEGVEVIGPVTLPAKGRHAWKVLVKSSAKEKVTRYSRRLIESLRDEKGLRTIVDVDPIRL